MPVKNRAPASPVPHRLSQKPSRASSDFGSSHPRPKPGPRFSKFSRAIGIIRHYRRWTQAELARRLGCSRQYVWEIENGYACISRANPTIPALASVLEVNFTKLRRLVPTKKLRRGSKFSQFLLDTRNASELNRKQADIKLGFELGTVCALEYGRRPTAEEILTIEKTFNCQIPKNCHTQISRTRRPIIRTTPLGKWLTKERLEKRGMTQRELANWAKISTGTISGLELGTNQLGRNVYPKLVAAFGSIPEELLPLKLRRPPVA